MRALVFYCFRNCDQFLNIDKTIEALHSNSSPADRDGYETAKESKILFGPELNHAMMRKPKNLDNFFKGISM